MRSIILASVAALALMGTAHADSVVVTKPGLTLAGPQDNIVGITISYSGSTSTALATFHVRGGPGYPSSNVSARFDTAQAAIQAAQAFNAEHGGYQLGNAGGAIVVKNSTRTVKALRPGIDGIVHEVQTNRQMYGHFIKNSFYKSNGDCVGWCGGPAVNANVAKVSLAKTSSGIGVKGGGANYGHAVSK